VTRVGALQVTYFIEHDDVVPVTCAEDRVQWSAGRVSVPAIWPRLRDPFEAEYYISGPPPMLRGIGDDLRSRNISPEAIHIDAWE
jgi:ferredoxin-NADP reductase